MRPKAARHPGPKQSKRDEKRCGEILQQGGQQAQERKETAATRRCEKENGNKYRRVLTEGHVELPPLVCWVADIDQRERRKAPNCRLSTAEEVHQDLHGHGSPLCQRCSQRAISCTIRVGGRDGVHTGQRPRDRRGERNGVQNSQVSAPERRVLEQIAIRYRAL